ncbi:nucleotidyltransferase domain-containing protein [Sulfurimonas sp.]|jgi:predicted nucleotidyltransferase|uniref:nucleotidyltransferase domain-containing protein n=1 Tax=Sulfurimonas sp. TaxID=2022749 RepID=UPI0025FB906E|nr:nucleotidyltransferase domain-containing protein [Sulfurimonas sp.]MBT5933972.1 nucleotidyltransferase domain-containing protein [Sulfurimonas sp.]
MRLNKYYIHSIKTVFDTIFANGTISLFGSRVDDSKKGGDIDLFIEIEDKTDLFEKKIRFLSLLKQKIDDQKIDVVFNEDSSRLIEKEARKWAIVL